MTMTTPFLLLLSLVLPSTPFLRSLMNSNEVNPNIFPLHIDMIEVWIFKQQVIL